MLTMSMRVNMLALDLIMFTLCTTSNNSNLQLLDICTGSHKTNF